MRTLLRHEYQIARKDYNCDGCRDLLYVGVDGMGLTISELREVVKAKRQQYKILPGQRYLKQVTVDNGTIYTWRCLPEIHEIMNNHQDTYFMEY